MESKSISHILIAEDLIMQLFGDLKDEVVQLKSFVKNLAATGNDRLLTLDHVAKILNRCPRTIYNRLKNREISHIEIKGDKYIYQSELDRYLKEYTILRKVA